MKQRRFSGKSQWYHETQSSGGLAEVQPLVPEAAQVDDRFLLDLTLSDLQLAREAPWLSAARSISNELLPESVTTNPLFTLNSYERLTTALTVAQVCGIQRLCSHYAARLAPQSSSDSSRESNRRLTQITQFSRQLASQPTSISEDALTQLDECGLSVEDIITFIQIIGFIGFQARIIAVWHAVERIPVRPLPGLSAQQDADPTIFSRRAVLWQSNLPPLKRRYANKEQTHLRGVSLVSPVIHELADLLAYDSPTLLAQDQLARLLWPANPSLSTDDLLVMMVVSRINGSACCFNDAAAKWSGEPDLPDAIRNGEKAVYIWSQNHPRERAIIQATQLLTRSPDRFSYAELAPLFEQGFNEQQVIQLFASSGLAGWLNRLRIGLGYTFDEPKTLLL